MATGVHPPAAPTVTKPTYRCGTPCHPFATHWHPGATTSQRPRAGPVHVHWCLGTANVLCCVVLCHQAIYLHIFSDAFSSVAVICSALLVKWQGWLVVDALQCLVVAGGTLYTCVACVFARGLALFCLLSCPFDSGANVVFTVPLPLLWCTQRHSIVPSHGPGSCPGSARQPEACPGQVPT